ncbi:hypothetical protein P8H27_10650 [Pseudomonas sp. sp1636]|uniref:hypothetical protein n=1 Tax=Pseudomonas sp. sp1636 TaxID=3036707 RepID=UPI0025A63DD0|nr:hypothetical protein [Pseudomonas sp. sp1636]MDM8349358.1 hypothetical protein [Pseudomonas sp. sp1636]
MTQPHQGKTSAQHGTTLIPVSLQQDFITVVGASPMTLLESLRGQKGNKMRFINQGIRQARLYPPATANDSTQRIFLIFTEDYERQLLDRVKVVVESRYGAKYRELDSIAQLVDFINQRIGKKREIKQLDFFSHGLVAAFCKVVVASAVFLSCYFQWRLLPLWVECDGADRLPISRGP